MDSSESSPRIRQHRRHRSLRPAMTTERHAHCKYTEYVGPDFTLSSFDPSSESEVSFMSDISDQFVVPFEGKASIISSSINLINTISGAGLMTLPYAIMRSGWVLGMLSMVIVIIIGSISFYLLSFISDALQVFNYGAIATKLCNNHVGNLVNILIIVLTLGLLVAFMVLIRENMFFFSPNPDLEWAQQLLLVLIAVLVISPLSLVKNLNSLWFTSLLSIICLIYVMGMIFTFAILTNNTSALQNGIVQPVEREPATAFSFTFSTLMAIASLSITFCGHYNSLNVYKEVRAKSLTKMKHIIVIVAISVAVLNLVVGLSGYFIFTDQCLPDILLNLADYASAHIWNEIANVSIILVLVFSFPVVCFALRRAVEDAIFKTEYVRRKWSTTISLIAVFFSTLVGCFVNDIGIVLDMIGLLAGVPLVFIFPAIFTLLFLNSRSHYNRQFSRALRLQQVMEQSNRKPRHANRAKTRIGKGRQRAVSISNPLIGDVQENGADRASLCALDTLNPMAGEEETGDVDTNRQRKNYNNYYMGPVQIAQERIFRNVPRLKRLRVLSWVTCSLGSVVLISALGMAGYTALQSI